MQISRVNRSKRAAKKTYDRLSSFYDLLAGTRETQFMHRGLELMPIHTGGTILEIGSGTGKALVELGNQVGETGKVHGIDLSMGMLLQSRHRLGKAGLQARVVLIEGDGTRLPYKRGSFTAIFISFTLELFDTPEIPFVLEECQRVLVPGGLLGVVSLRTTESPGRIVRLYEWFHVHFPTYVDCRPIDAQGMVQAAGFKIVKKQIGRMWGLPVEVMLAGKA